MSIKIYKRLISIAIALLTINSFAQQPVVHTTIDSTHILIGQQTRLNVEIAANREPAVQLPLIVDTLMEGVEVLETSKIDTTDIGNDRIQLKYNYLITSFDSALYLLPPIKIIQNTDTVFSESLALKVSTLPVDLESKEFYDIKTLQKPRFVIWDYAVYFIVALLIAAVALIIIYLIKAKNPLKPFQKTIPREPSHVIALNELERIREEKLWQQNRVKEYHSRITDAIRQYISERFNINAMEMTSGEILDAAHQTDIIKPVFSPLQQILTTADFVKFAKYSPLPDENEISLSNAFLFVKETKPEETVAETEKIANS